MPVVELLLLSAKCEDFDAGIYIIVGGVVTIYYFISEWSIYCT